MGIDVEGERVPLLPILIRLLERGGIEGMPVTDGRVHAPLDDGRLVALPAERVGKLLAIIAPAAGLAIVSLLTYDAAASFVFGPERVERLLTPTTLYGLFALAVFGAVQSVRNVGDYFSMHWKAL